MLEPIARDPRRSGLFLDFDGTLSEIVPTPEEAQPLREVGPLLAALSERYGVVAIVTGRRSRDVVGRLPAHADLLVLGLYGLEGSSEPIAPSGGVPVERIMPELERAAALVPGAAIERKGPQVAVHFRGARDPVAAERILTERLGLIAERHQLRLLEGKKVLELAPLHGPTKGDAVRATAERRGLRAVLYAGDDVADLEAFAAVDDLVGHGLDGVKVAVRSAETPAELLDRSDLVVEGPAGLLDLLRELAKA